MDRGGGLGLGLGLGGLGGEVVVGVQVLELDGGDLAYVPLLA